MLATNTLASPHQQPRIYGGKIAQRCEFPTTLYAKGCTGILVHPRVVLSAGHCPPTDAFDFGEHASAPAMRVSVKWCESTDFSATDARICVLRKAVLGLPVAPIIQGCELDELKANAEVLVAGFGLDEGDPKTGAQPDEKRWVATTINEITPDELNVGGGGKGGCQGDSGGPVYLQLKDGSYRTVGVTHGGVAHPHCDKGIYKRADQLLDWYELQLEAHAETDIDLRPCFDRAKNWAPSAACGGYSKDVKGPFGDWSNLCGQGQPHQRFSASCGPPFDPTQSSTTGSRPSSPSTSSSGSRPGLIHLDSDTSGTQPTRAPSPAPVAAQPRGTSCAFTAASGGNVKLLSLIILALGSFFRIDAKRDRCSRFASHRRMANGAQQSDRSNRVPAAKRPGS